MYKPLISVIVPIYNMEKYLDRCIKSIIEQSYTHIEILLVNDGSTDASKCIAEDWAEQDKRIRLINRENGGLSAARNTGIKAATGEYLSFIDSDDWIHKDMLGDMIKRASEADIVSCGMIKATDEKNIPIKWFETEKIISKEEALDLLVDNKIFTSHVMRNIYPKRYFEKLKFPEGKVFEDIRIMHKIFQQVGTVCIIPEHYYYYYEREDSITNIVKLKNILEWYEALNDRAIDLQNTKAEYIEKIHAQMAVVVSLAMVQNTFSKEEKEKCMSQIRCIMDFLRLPDTQKYVKKYATNSQCMYFRLAKFFSFSANKLYKIIRGQ